ncbi:LytTR family DNA-binding domain-containing protein [Marinilabilia salmonicolor]|jgi:two-component system LytT family response regulator|uniref:LytTR family two component transcriptional regulator n=1 Tax=Marinilabilia salmonicolor TaxID=989 RepID=A0A2T0XS70_9BACT|nr:LytTR family DNA-binding domain-containing protein [Marinilabilia salmonicolor]PRZ01746.1 LytTR family two component transcriptional regulator [Marinilabilia salmonicolor]RCW31322.1 LytTR family two component transcriptional regulator [Marinilabilia salmonicolor]
MKKVLIVEDDRVMQKIVGEILRHHFPEFELLGAVSLVSEAVEIIHEETPDLLILDIALPDGTAFDLLQKVEFYNFKVVFMSGHEDFREEAIQFSAVGFVKKPFDVSDLVLAVDKACEAIDEAEYHYKLEILLTNANLPAASQMVVFPVEGMVKAVSLSSILFGEAVAGGSVMHIENGQSLFVPRPLRYYEQLFANFGFLRCHPLYVVNLRRIESLDEKNTLVWMDEGSGIPLEARKYETVKKRYYEIVP